MGVSVDSGNKSGKKPLNADLNLVPYIDLLTCMVAFLLITAVWSQLARLNVHQAAFEEALQVIRGIRWTQAAVTRECACGGAAVP